jgi:hypothetical protein
MKSLVSNLKSEVLPSGHNFDISIRLCKFRVAEFCLAIRWTLILTECQRTFNWSCGKCNLRAEWNRTLLLTFWLRIPLFFQSLHAVDSRRSLHPRNCVKTTQHILIWINLTTNVTVFDWVVVTVTSCLCEDDYELWVSRLVDSFVGHLAGLYQLPELLIVEEDYRIHSRVWGRNKLIYASKSLLRRLLYVDTIYESGLSVSLQRYIYF